MAVMACRWPGYHTLVSASRRARSHDRAALLDGVLRGSILANIDVFLQPCEVAWLWCGRWLGAEKCIVASLHDKYVTATVVEPAGLLAANWWSRYLAAGLHS